MDSQNNSKKNKFWISCAIIFIVLYLIVNLSAVTGLFEAILSVIAPILIGGAIAYLLNPLLKLFEFKILKKIKNNSLKKGVSILLTYVVALLLITGFLLLLIPQLIESVLDLSAKFDLYVEDTTKIVNDIIGKFSPDTRVNKENIINALTSFFLSSGTVFDFVMDYAKDFVLGLYVGLKNAILGIFISVYILAAKERLHAQIRRITEALFKDKTRTLLLRYVRIANRTFGNFFIGKIVNSSIIGIITYIALLIFGVPYPLLIATIVGITDIIPVFGPFIGAIPSAIIIFIANPYKALVFVLIILVIQQLDGNILAPRILGNSTGISSLGVIVAIVVMGDCFGVIGMIVGVPIFAVITILANEFIESKLKSKGRPIKTDDYYPAYSLVDPHEQHEKVGERIFRSLFGGISKVFKKISKKDTSHEEKDEVTSETPDTNSEDKTSDS